MRRAGEKEVMYLKMLAENDVENKKHCIQYLGSFDHEDHLCMVFEAMHQARSSHGILSFALCFMIRVYLSLLHEDSDGPINIALIPSIRNICTPTIRALRVEPAQAFTSTVSSCSQNLRMALRQHGHKRGIQMDAVRIYARQVP